VPGQDISHPVQSDEPQLIVIQVCKTSLDYFLGETEVEVFQAIFELLVVDEPVVLEVHLLEEAGGGFAVPFERGLDLDDCVPDVNLGYFCLTREEAEPIG
jgi:hypothetical protein